MTDPVGHKGCITFGSSVRGSTREKENLMSESLMGAFFFFFCAN
jgi:hypothetical protein